MRLPHAVAVFLVLHATAHLVGAQTALTAASDHTTAAYLFDSWHPGGFWLYILGTAWTTAALGYVLTAWRLWSLHEGWRHLLIGVTVGSLVLSLLALPQAAIGVALDILLLAGVARWNPGSITHRPIKDR